MLLFKNIVKNFISVFRGQNLLWVFGAVAVTTASVITGFDWDYFVWLRNTPLYSFFFPAVILGAIFPIIVPLSLVLAGKLRKSKELVLIGWVLGQAALLGSLVSSLLKVFTGRIPPPFFLTPDTIDIANGFRFGFLEGGIFWGWPSSHTTIAFAMAFALVILFSKNKMAMIGAIVYAFYIGIGISLSIHWFSEFIAGALIGTSIGLIVGKSFARKR